MKYKVGDRVKVVKCDIEGMFCRNIGKIFTITKINNNNGEYPYVMDKIGEYFGEDELELVREKQFTKADLKDGDIVTYRNGIRRLVNATNKKIVFIQNPNILSFDFCDFRADLTNKNKEGKEYDIVKIERPVKYETVFEKKEEILDEAEKKYLANVIRPFKNEVQHIVKYDNPLHIEKEYLRIKLINNEEINFPDFEEGSMYKRMERDKKYTLEELKL